MHIIHIHKGIYILTTGSPVVTQLAVIFLVFQWIRRQYRRYYKHCGGG